MRDTGQPGVQAGCWREGAVDDETNEESLIFARVTKLLRLGGKASGRPGAKGVIQRSGWHVHLLGVLC